MKPEQRSRSFTDLVLGPNQRSQFDQKPPKPAEGKVATANAPKTEKGGASLLWVYVFGIVAMAMGVLHQVNRPTFDEIVHVFEQCITFQRLPATAQDNIAAAAWVAISIPVVAVIDLFVCYPLGKNHVARWYFIHAMTNVIVTVLATPDIYYTLLAPHRGVEVKYCDSLPFPACSDLPTCFIIGLHLYHVLFFKLTGGDIFHHLLFVPLVGLAHFVVPCGSSANILCFFISGFPGGIDYFLLGLVKNGSMHPIREKRINCSINTWIRAPGITIRCDNSTSM